jgi:hypothetical protein
VTAPVAPAPAFRSLACTVATSTEPAGGVNDAVVIVSVPLVLAPDARAGDEASTANAMIPHLRHKGTDCYRGPIGSSPEGTAFVQSVRACASVVETKVRFEQNADIQHACCPSVEFRVQL